MQKTLRFRRKKTNPRKLSDARRIKNFLSRSYSCRKVPGGVECFSAYGIGDKRFDKFHEDVKQAFGDRFSEIYHEVNYRHKKFMVFLKPKLT